ncbi:hypothetical protein KDW49_01160 [Burkholderia dolosa]|jgi:hypothetical protein|nr:hypothetical protein [Burkholderia dolosa]
MRASVFAVAKRAEERCTRGRLERPWCAQNDGASPIARPRENGPILIDVSRLSATIGLVKWREGESGMDNQSIRNRCMQEEVSRIVRHLPKRLRRRKAGPTRADDAARDRDRRGGGIGAQELPAWAQPLCGGITEAQSASINALRERDIMLRHLLTVFGPDCIVNVVSGRVRIVHETATEWFDLPAV